MANLFIDTDILPDGSSAFVFGSYLRSHVPRDLDLLIIYDDSSCPADDAYNRHAEFVAAVQNKVDLPVHITLLSLVEACVTQFVAMSTAIPLEQVAIEMAPLRELHGSEGEK